MQPIFSLKRYFEKNLYFILGIIISIILCVDVFSQFKAFAYEIFFNSDSLTLPSIYRSLFVDGFPLKGWHFNSSPNFFPDMLFYFLLMKLTANDFILSSFLYGCIQYVVILFLFKKIFYLVFPQAAREMVLLIVILQALFLIEMFYFTKDFTWVFYFLSNSYHVSAFLLSLWCFYLLLNYVGGEKNGYYLVYIFIISFLGSLCDKLFIVLFPIPVLGICVLKIRSIGIPSAARIILTVIVAVGSGVVLFEVLAKSGYIYFSRPFKMFDFENIVSSFFMLMDQCKTYMSEVSFKSLSMYLTLVAFVTLCVIHFSKKTQSDKLVSISSLFLILFSFIGFWTVVLNGGYTGWDCLRYNIYPFYTMCLTIPFIVMMTGIPESFRPVGKKVVVLGAGVYLVIAYLNFNMAGLKAFFSYYPERVAALDALAEHNNLRVGVSNYWDARKTTMFSKKNLRVYAVFNDLAIYDLSSNENWYFNPDVYFDFIILNGFSDTTTYKSKIAKTSFIVNTDQLSLVKTSLFRYNKPEAGYSPINVE